MGRVLHGMTGRKVRVPSPCKHHGQGVRAHKRRGQGLYLVGFEILLVDFFKLNYAFERVTTK